MAYLEDHETISESEFEELLEVVHQDLLNQWTPQVMIFPESVPEEVQLAGYVPGAIAGRDRYDTPLWNAGKADTVVCVDGHGCYHRSEVNYVAQGMWGAVSGETLDESLTVVEWWNQEGGQRAGQGEYGHSASPGELYWTQVKWNWASEKGRGIKDYTPKAWWLGGYK